MEKKKGREAAAAVLPETTRGHEDVCSRRVAARQCQSSAHSA